MPGLDSFSVSWLHSRLCIRFRHFTVIISRMSQEGPALEPPESAGAADKTAAFFEWSFE
ncbi:MAG: hypothetical protein LBP88_00415 [Treponema sp.]|nr:hypothetical protein [Treponema sp.]